MAVHKPPALKPGGWIGVVAPAGSVDAAALDAGVKAIESQGFHVELAPGILERKGYLAGAAELRARELGEFFARADINAIFCARGGFGSIQLLPHLRGKLSGPPKIFVGYSDITVLLNWLRCERDLVTFHGPMVAMDLARGLPAQSDGSFWPLLCGQWGDWHVGLGEVLRPGKVTAELMGGCLSMLVTTLGTPYEIDTRGKILFLEDIGEKPYRLERMLIHLQMAGKFDAVAGLVFGDFTDCDGPGPRDLRAIVGEMFSSAKFPVVMGVPAGHGMENVILPFGVPVALDAAAARLTLTESPLA